MFHQIIISYLETPCLIILNLSNLDLDKTDMESLVTMDTKIISKSISANQPRS